MWKPFSMRRILRSSIASIPCARGFKPLINTFAPLDSAEDATRARATAMRLNVVFARALERHEHGRAHEVVAQIYGPDGPAHRCRREQDVEKIDNALERLAEDMQHQ